MKALKSLLWLVLALPGFCQAVPASWNASSGGPLLVNRGVAASSRPLVAPADTRGEITEVIWHYRLSTPAPAGLFVRLCSSNRCVPLEGGSGTTRGLANIAADDTLQFIFQVEGKGRIWPQPRVLSAGVKVNYEAH